ncbi:MAG: ORF6N domain-containing protein [Bacteroidetes bacterium]|nr:ORF6N domain-containing protein [Bacteroidota bacterium]
MNTDIIRDRIYFIRGQRVMLDFDLATLYGVETKALNQAVKRNSDRFPEDFMFRLTEEEWQMRSQIVTASGEGGENVDNQQVDMRSQIVTASGGAKFRNKGVLPYAFTEHGVTMLASVLRSEKAVSMSIAVVRAFIALKEYVVQRNALTDQLQEIRDRLGEHDAQLNSIYTAIENLLDEKAEQKNWEDRERIGFKKR